MDENIVAVFCGESFGNRELYYRSMARNLGRLLALSNYTVATGGGPGLMCEVNEAAFKAGGRVISVQLDVPGRRQCEYFTESYLYASLRARQEYLLHFANALVILPGGLGTVFEALEVLTLKRIEQFPIKSPIVFVDRIYYSHLNDFIQNACDSGFISLRMEQLCDFVDTPEQAIERLNAAFS